MKLEKKNTKRPKKKNSKDNNTKKDLLFETLGNGCIDIKFISTTCSTTHAPYITHISTEAHDHTTNRIYVKYVVRHRPALILIGVDFGD